MKRNFFATALMVLLPLSSQAAVVYDTWTTNDGLSGNYELTVTDLTGGSFGFNLTVNPWNAEPLGMFVDLGNQDVSGLIVSGVSTSPTTTGTVVLFGTDTTSNNCGSGCNLNGLNPPAANPDGEWEMVFRLGENGYEGLQTFDWTVGGLIGVSESDFGIVGMRAQQLCDPGELLPDGSCEGSDKSYSAAGTVVAEIPLPAAAWLFGSALLGLGAIKRRKA